MRSNTTTKLVAEHSIPTSKKCLDRFIGRGEGLFKNQRSQNPSKTFERAERFPRQCCTIVILQLNAEELVDKACSFV